jgi:hypothetical protein
LQAVSATLGRLHGVAAVFSGPQLSAEGGRRTPAAMAAALSYFDGRSGDLIVVPAPYWLLIHQNELTEPGSAATHGTSNTYDQRVPLILFGYGIRPGLYATPASPADIAPTLASLVGVDLGARDGRILREATRR